MIVLTNLTGVKNSQQRIGSALIFIWKVICSVDEDIVSKETVVLRRWGTGTNAWFYQQS